MNMAAPNTRDGQAPSIGSSLIPAGAGRLFLLVCGLFFLWGIPNNLNDVLIRQFMKSFAISRFQAGLVQSAFYLGYFLLALPAGILIRTRGYKTGFVAGLTLFATGCFLFLPAAQASRYSFFLIALFVVASGLAFLETAANPFIAQLGPSVSSESRLNLAQAFNPVGAILGVLVGTRFIFSGIELSSLEVSHMRLAGTYNAYLRTETLRVVTPYLVLGCIAVVWLILIALAKFPAFIREDEQAAVQRSDWRKLLKEPHFLLSLPAQFLYVGAQVGTWSYFIAYAQEYAHTTERSAGLLLTCTLGAFGLGRLSSSYMMRYMSPSKLMAAYALCNTVLVAVGITWKGWAGLLAILVTSFFMSIMFPTIFALGLKGLGGNTNIAGSLLVMTIIGGAILTPVMGWIAEHFQSTAVAYAVPLCCYMAILAYSLLMSRLPEPHARVDVVAET